MNKYDVLGVVGEGAYGVVLKCKNKDPPVAHTADSFSSKVNFERKCERSEGVMPGESQQDTNEVVAIKKLTPQTITEVGLLQWQPEDVA